MRFGAADSEYLLVAEVSEEAPAKIRDHVAERPDFVDVSLGLWG